MKEKLAAMADERSASLTDWHGTNTVVTPEDCGYTGGFAAEAIQQVIVHQLMHKMYPLDHVTESLIVNTLEEGSPASNFAN